MFFPYSFLGTLVIRKISAIPFQNQSAFISWNYPSDIPFYYKVIVRWGELNMTDPYYRIMPIIIEETAENVTMPVVCKFSRPFYLS